MSHVKFYYYTNSSGKEAILSSGVIHRTSNPCHKWYGEGIYGTSMAPSAGKKNIAENCWGQYGPESVATGSLDWAFKLKLPADDVTHHGGNKDILKHKGPINIYDCIKWKVVRVNEN